MKIVSACSVGINCKENGTNDLNITLLNEFRKGDLLPVCPELLGAFWLPKSSLEIMGGTGKDVLEGKAKVMDLEGNNVTDKCIRGAQEALRLAREVGATEAILNSSCPSCASVTAALFRDNGIGILSDQEF